MLSLLRLECKQKDFWKSTLNLHITLSFLFGIEMTNTFMHSLKNHTEQNGTKTIPFGAAFTYKGIYKGVSHPPPPLPRCFSFFQHFFIFKCTGYRLGDTEGGGSQPLPETVSSRNSGIQQENVRANILLLFLVEFWKIILKRVSLTDLKF